MSYKSLITHVVPDRGCASRLRMTASVARVLGARVIGLGARGTWPRDAGDEDSFREARDEIETELDAARAAFEDHFTGSGAGAGIETLWRAEVCSPDRVMARHARLADLAVAYPTRGDIDRLDYAAPDELVMETGLPVLLMPMKETEFRTDSVLVAWKNTREARRALTVALPMLKMAGRVLVAAICGDAEIDTVERELVDVADRLARHGVHASTLAEVDSAGAAGHRLLRIAATDGSDLVVSGAYGHSRLREWALGGVTRDLIFERGPYILMSH